ncbi:chromosomal replication initiator protein DnaA [Alkalilacustris brevis]|uniref:chromosomal replication initiator protein DnaA n=1 Tax=Alkalilacustris brevis TaxID=2026338 RepID=UPI000E0D21C9|nr:chromosomal replication initiator protein DnaA [Alkalilacustris brevis]
MGKTSQDETLQDSWDEVRSALQSSIGRNNFVTWIEPLQLRGLSNGILRVAVPTRFIGEWVSRNYNQQILREYARIGVPVSRIDFQVSRPSQPKAEKKSANTANCNGVESRAAQNRNASAAGPAPQSSETANEEGDLPGAALDRRFTFDRFVVGKPNELAHAAARRVGEGGAVTFNPLFLYGGVGLGKTHLMHAIAWELNARQPEMRVLYLSAEQFMYRFIQALRDRQIMDFKELFRSVDVLMVDDVQFIAGKDSTQDEFFHTFNALVDQGKQIIISADRAPGEIKDLEERIKSRLQCGLVVDLHPTDYELRLGILQQKTENYRHQYGGIEVASGVLEFLAHRITTNVRVLEGALTRLFAFASLVGREITLDLAQDCLADILRASDRRVTVEEIQRKVSEHYNIRLADMIGPKRVRTIARPRQIAMYLAKELTSRSLPEIGRRFGGRDHTTIIHGVRKVETLRESDPQIAEDVDLLRRLLSG